MHGEEEGSIGKNKNLVETKNYKQPHGTSHRASLANTFLAKVLCANQKAPKFHPDPPPDPRFQITGKTTFVPSHALPAMLEPSATPIGGIIPGERLQRCWTLGKPLAS